MLYGQGWGIISIIIAPPSIPTFFEKSFMSSARALGLVSVQKACAIGVTTKRKMIISKQPIRGRAPSRMLAPPKKISRPDPITDNSGKG